jgi:hypothetical protein
VLWNPSLNIRASQGAASLWSPDGRLRVGAHTQAGQPPNSCKREGAFLDQPLQALAAAFDSHHSFVCLCDALPCLPPNFPLAVLANACLLTLAGFLWWRAAKRAREEKRQPEGVGDVETGAGGLIARRRRRDRGRQAGQQERSGAAVASGEQLDHHDSLHSGDDDEDEDDDELVHPSAEAAAMRWVGGTRGDSQFLHQSPQA